MSRSSASLCSTSLTSLSRLSSSINSVLSEVDSVQAACEMVEFSDGLSSLSCDLPSVHSLIVGETGSSDNGSSDSEACPISETSFRESELATSLTMETVTTHSSRHSIVSALDADTCQFYVTVENDDEVTKVVAPGVIVPPEIYSDEDDDDESIKLSHWPTTKPTTRKVSSPGATKKEPVLKTLADAIAASMNSVEIDFVGDLGIVESGANPLPKVPEETEEADEAPSYVPESCSVPDCSSSLIDPFEEDSEEYRSFSCKSLAKLNLEDQAEGKQSEGDEDSSGSFLAGFPYASKEAIVEAFAKKLKRLKRQFPEATEEQIISKYGPRFPPEGADEEETKSKSSLLDTFDTRIYESSDDDYDYPLHYARKTHGNSISMSSTVSADATRTEGVTESQPESELDEPLASEDSQSVASEAEKASQSEDSQSEDSQSEASQSEASQSEVSQSEASKSSVSEPKVDEPKAQKPEASVVAIESKQAPVVEAKPPKAVSSTKGKPETVPRRSVGAPSRVVRQYLKAPPPPPPPTPRSGVSSASSVSSVSSEGLSSDNSSNGAYPTYPTLGSDEAFRQWQTWQWQQQQAYQHQIQQQQQQAAQSAMGHQWANPNYYPYGQQTAYQTHPPQGANYYQAPPPPTRPYHIDARVRTQQYYPDSGSPRPNQSGAAAFPAPSGGSPAPWSRYPPPPPNITDHQNVPSGHYGQYYSGTAGYEQGPSTNTGYSRRSRGGGSGAGPADRFNGANSRGGGTGRPGSHRDRSTYETRPSRRSMASNDRLGSEFEPTGDPKPSYQIQNQHQSRSNGQWPEYQDSSPPSENQSNLQNRQQLNRRTSRGVGGAANEGVTRGGIGRGARFSDRRQNKNWM